MLSAVLAHRAVTCQQTPDVDALDDRHHQIQLAFRATSGSRPQVPRGIACWRHRPRQENSKKSTPTFGDGGGSPPTGPDKGKKMNKILAAAATAAIGFTVSSLVAPGVAGASPAPCLPYIGCVNVPIDPRGGFPGFGGLPHGLPGMPGMPAAPVIAAPPPVMAPPIAPPPIAPPVLAAPPPVIAPPPVAPPPVVEAAAPPPVIAPPVAPPPVVEAAAPPPVAAPAPAETPQQLMAPMENTLKGMEATPAPAAAPAPSPATELSPGMQSGLQDALANGAPAPAAPPTDNSALLAPFGPTNPTSPEGLAPPVQGVPLPPAPAVQEPAPTPLAGPGSAEAPAATPASAPVAPAETPAMPASAPTAPAEAAPTGTDAYPGVVAGSAPAPTGDYCTDIGVCAPPEGATHAATPAATPAAAPAPASGTGTGPASDPNWAPPNAPPGNYACTSSQIAAGVCLLPPPAGAQQGLDGVAADCAGAAYAAAYGDFCAYAGGSGVTTPVVSGTPAAVPAAIPSGGDSIPLVAPVPPANAFADPNAFLVAPVPPANAFPDPNAAPPVDPNALAAPGDPDAPLQGGDIPPASQGTQDALANGAQNAPPIDPNAPQVASGNGTSNDASCQGYDCPEVAPPAPEVGSDAAVWQLANPGQPIPAGMNRTAQQGLCPDGQSVTPTSSCNYQFNGTTVTPPAAPQGDSAAPAAAPAPSGTPPVFYAPGTPPPPGSTPVSDGHGYIDSNGSLYCEQGYWNTMSMTCLGPNGAAAPPAAPAAAPVVIPAWKPPTQQDFSNDTPPAPAAPAPAVTPPSDLPATSVPAPNNVCPPSFQCIVRNGIDWILGR